MAWWLYVVLIFLVVLAIGFLFYFFQIKTEEQDDLIEQSKQRLDDMVNTLMCLLPCKENQKSSAIKKCKTKLDTANCNQQRVAEQDARIAQLRPKNFACQSKSKGTYYVVNEHCEIELCCWKETHSKDNGRT